MDLVKKVGFGSMTFDKNMMKKSLPKPVYLKWKDATRNTGQLDKDTADVIASEMKKWATEMGATHFCHWFQPLNGKTAKKNDAFIERSSDNEPIEKFSGDQLIKNESDASSFPNGGIRSTFEARGYTYWDLTSNSFIMDNVMYIPSIFVSYTGETLDKKRPLLKSLDYLSENVTKVVNKVSENKAYRTGVKLGLEQEFFLISKELYDKRTDLKAAGRTLLGVPRIKTQEQDHHYFGTLPQKVLKFYEDVNNELWSLGIYAITEHNEVAPSQFEIACLFNDANRAIDQNHIVMEVLQKNALKHDMVCLLHEKPYKNVNGSGKHNNYSLVTNEGLNLFDYKKDPLLFTIASLCLMEGTRKYSTLLRVGSSNVRNDFRLGGSEAPPAIISIYLGNEAEEIIYKYANAQRKSIGKMSNINLNRLGYTPVDNSDRNRTSPFAFTGNKFEFRMLGSSLSASDLNISLNTIIGAAFENLYSKIENLEGQDLQDKLNEIISQMLVENEAILYNGDNYSQEWIEESQRRGIKNYSTYLEALLNWKEPAQVLVEKGIFSQEELEALYEIMMEETVSYYEIEANALLNIVQKNVEPYAMNELIRHGKMLIHVENIMVKKQMEKLNNNLSQILEIKEEIIELIEQAKAKNDEERALFYRDTINVNLEDLRYHAETIEAFVGKDLWKLPTYEDIFDSVK